MSAATSKVAVIGPRLAGGVPGVRRRPREISVRDAQDILHLAELVPIVRERLAVDCAFPDDAILSSLRTISARSSARDRWTAAFESNLGHWLALKGKDLNAALNGLLVLLPSPRS